MAYQGSAAYRIDAYQDAWGTPVRRPLSVHEGGQGRLARTNAPASASALVRVALTLGLAFGILGGVRVALTTVTVNLLREVATAQATVEQAQVTRTELQVERSALSSADRIQRIATENYGMAYATDVDTITLRDEAPSSAEDANASDDAGVGFPVA
ncbi:MAG: hypothetical protein QM302_01515 [Acidobacteriota bacterium]|nr:hypothetical protein [Acidobacteriota bacterium]